MEAISTLSSEEIRRMKETFRQVDGIFALEGFHPDEQTHAIRAALLAGRVTNAQVIEELRDYAMQRKTTEGFIESRTWRVSAEHQRLLLED